MPHIAYAAGLATPIVTECSELRMVSLPSDGAPRGGVPGSLERRTRPRRDAEALANRCRPPRAAQAV